METSDFELLKNINLYDILGFISKDDFTPDLAKKNYRKLALKYHPDKNSNNDSSDKFEILQLAYLILTSPEQKEKYDFIYDNNSQIKDFIDLKDSIKGQQFQFKKISEEEFKKKIHELNIYNNSIFNKLDVVDQISAQDTTLKMLVEREKYIDELKDYHKETYDVLTGISNQTELNQKFNEIFDYQTSETNQYNSDGALLELQSSNISSDTLCNYTILSNMDYNSMYSKKSLYDESFKINKSIKFINDNKTLEERMNDYLSNSNKLAELAKKSSSSTSI